MAQGYALRYFKTYDLNRHNVKLEIYKKYPAVEYAPKPMEIGRVLQGLTLDVQGEQDDIISPIVKTSLSMTFADAPGVEVGKKTGDWEEFYTPDSTGYKVLLYLDGAVYWSGYVTPDSFEEDLEYHGSVTIVARDNIGHLQDFSFDEIGNDDAMISVKNVIEFAWDKVECLLNLTYANGADVVWPMCEGYSALNCVMNVEAFKDKNWYEVLESVLDSFGLALRVVGNNKAMIMPLRALPCLDKQRLSLVEVKNVLLQASGHRSLMMAMKSIKDVAKYDVEREVLTPNVKKDDFIGIQLNYRCAIEGDNYSKLEHDAPVWPIFPKSNGWRDLDTAYTLNFNAHDYDLGYFLNRSENEESVKGASIMYIAANNVDDRYTEYRQRILCKNFALKMQLGEPIGVTKAGKLEKYSSDLRLRKIIYQLMITDADSSVKYWDGGTWKDNATDIIVTYDTASSVTEFISKTINFNDIEAESVLFTFRIKKIEYYAVGYLGVPDIGIYARVLKTAIVVPEDVSIMDEFTLNSIYDESHNYLINRDCDIVASSQSFVTPKVITNGIYLPIDGYKSAWQWQWPNGATTSLQALIAQQILMYYSQPNSIITGTLLANAEKGEILNFNCLWRWRNKTLALVSGQLDLMTGFIESAKLREYKDWEALWPDEGLMITEDGAKYVTSEAGDKVKIAKIYYNLVSEKGDFVKSEAGEQVKLNGKL